MQILLPKVVAIAGHLPGALEDRLVQIRRLKALIITAAWLFVWALAGCANGEKPLSPTTIEFPGTKVDPRLDFQAITTPPFAFTLFCLRYAEECNVHDAGWDNPSNLSQGRLDELAEINDEVNQSISPKANSVRMGFDAWRIAPLSGDCNDFAITKRHKLLARGWPSRSLLLVEVVTGRGEHHLILLARSGNEDIVLDNLSSAILDWTEAPYQWVRAQSPENPKIWVTVSKT